MHINFCSFLGFSNFCSFFKVTNINNGTHIEITPLQYLLG